MGFYILLKYRDVNQVIKWSFTWKTPEGLSIYIPKDNPRATLSPKSFSIEPIESSE